MTRHAKISARLSALVILACGLHAPNCLADGLSVSGSVDLTVVSSYLEGNQLTYNLTGTSLDLTWVTPPQLLSVSVHPLAIGGPQRRWGDPTVWDSPALFFANAVTINQTVTGVTTLPPNVSLFEETANSLKNLGPTEQTLTITPFSVRTLYFTVSLNVEVPLKFNVTLPTGADILMDQSPVILERLTVSSGANLIANSTVIIRHDLTNSGVIAGLGASIGGAFINNSGAMMSVRNLTVDGEFTNTGRITVINGLSRIAPTTNDGPITLAGGQLLFYGGLTDNGGINGYGRLPFSITEHVGITADVSGQTLTIEPAVGPIVINGGAPLMAINGGNLAIHGATINGSPVSVSGGGTLSTNGGVTFNGGSITANGGSVLMSFATVNGGTLSGGSGDSFVVSNSTLNQVSSSANIQVNNGVSLTGGTFVNNGTMTIGNGSMPGGQLPGLFVTEDTVVSGAGQFILNNARLVGGAYQGTAFEVTLDQPIRGSGMIQASLNDSSSITSDENGKTLSFDGSMGALTIRGGASLLAANGGSLAFHNTTVNGGSISVSGVGSLSIYGGTVNNASISAGTGPTTIYASTISQSTLSAGAGNSINVNCTFDRVINNAPILVSGNGSLGVIGGFLVNNNTITAGNGGSGGILNAVTFSGEVALGGIGEIALNNGQVLGDTVTMAASHSLRGWGLISTNLNLYGPLRADVNGQSLTLSGLINNHGSIASTNGAMLRLQSIDVNQDIGKSIAADGGLVELKFATINGGSLEGSYFDIYTGTTSLNSVVTNAPLRVYGGFGPGGTGLNVGGGAFVNNDTVTINYGNAGGSAYIAFEDNMNLSGAGQLILNNAEMRGGAINVTQGADHTLLGNGTIFARLVNHGLISPGIGLGMMTFTSPLSLLSDSEIHFEIGGTVQGSEYDFLSVTALVTLGGELSVTIFGDFGDRVAVNDLFTILDSSQALLGAFSNIANGERITTDDGRASFLVNYGVGSAFGSDKIVLSQAQAVPEPSTSLYLLVSGAVMLLRRKRP